MSPTRQVYQFGPFTLSAERLQLRREGEVVPLPRKAVETLLVLLERRGDVVEKEELMRRVWPDSFVEENNLNQCVSALRKAFGETALAPLYVETVARRGYRFRGDVTERDEGETSPPPAARAPVQERARPADRSLAVLPFRALGASEDEYLGVGICDTLITRLSNVGGLVVRPTSAVLKYMAPAEDRALAGRDLGVESVLEGGIRSRGMRMRVTAQLVRVADGAAFWADTFDEDAEDIFEVEDRIAERIASALTLELSGEDRSRLTRRPTRDVEAYRLYLKGRFHANRLSAEGFRSSLECFAEAIARDPFFALAYEGMAYHYFNTLDLFVAPHEAMPKAKEAAQKALAIDEHLAEAHAVLGIVRLFYDWDAAGAERSLARSVELEPRGAASLRLYGWFLALRGRFDEALALFDRATNVDSQSLEHLLYLPAALYFARRYDEAAECARRGLQLHPNTWLMHVMLGRCFEAMGDVERAVAEFETARHADDSATEVLGEVGRGYGLAGRETDARRVLAELEARSRRGYVAPFHVAVVHLGLGDLGQAFDWLDRAYRSRSWYMTWLGVAPIFDSIRDDERFRDLERRVGLGRTDER
jgi:DNA-binding winged helix-turn-helix (wHTH) protein/tetratricopeptide (TPR) repeat protein